jgi:hypothetical protein
MVCDGVIPNFSGAIFHPIDFFTGVLFDDGEIDAAAVSEIELDLIEERNGDEVVFVSRREWIKSHGCEDIPGRHFAGIVHARVSQFIPAHVIELVHDFVQDGLGLLLFADEGVHERHAMIRLVALAILADESRQVVGFWAGIRDSEQLV